MYISINVYIFINTYIYHLDPIIKSQICIIKPLLLMVKSPLYNSCMPWSKLQNMVCGIS